MRFRRSWQHDDDPAPKLALHHLRHPGWLNFVFNVVVDFGDGLVGVVG
jgi:hypothetical protein